MDERISKENDNSSNGNIIEIKTLNEKGEQIRIEKLNWENNLLTGHYCLNENNVILKDDVYEYSCFHDGNWLKRIKYSLKSEKKKEPVDVVYRSITYSDNYPQIEPIEIEDCKVLEADEKSLTFSNGSSYRGSLLNGKMDGNGYICWTDGSSYKGDFKNNLMDGKGILTWPNGDIYCGSFKKGKMEGVGRLRWKKGKIFYGIFENNKRTNQGIIEED